jgi:hypothetical protein
MVVVGGLSKRQERWDTRSAFRFQITGCFVLWRSMDLEDLAKRIRGACLEAVVGAYDDAGIQGLCAEGRWEAAVGALRTP